MVTRARSQPARWRALDAPGAPLLAAVGGSLFYIYFIPRAVCIAVIRCRVSALCRV
jgi:hypothetical protein